ncbi:MAG: hypothetical protein NVSMB65_03150 [Chloroflexota bacterium]
MTMTADNEVKEQPAPASDLLPRFALQHRLPAHHAVLDLARRFAGDEPRIVGLAVCGSVARGTADRNSDIDLKVVVDGDDQASAFADHLALLRAVGGGRYRTYDDLGPWTVRTLCEVASGQAGSAEPAPPSGAPARDSVAQVSLDVMYVPASHGMAGEGYVRWLYLRADAAHLVSLEQMPEAPVAPLSAADLQVLDARFWWWLHLLTLRARRGEVWNVLEESALRLRGEVLVRLLAHAAQQPFAGSRRVEQWLTPGLLDDLDATWSPARPTAIRAALLATVALYRRLRDAIASDVAVTFDRAAEDRIVALVHELPS